MVFAGSTLWSGNTLASMIGSGGFGSTGPGPMGPWARLTAVTTSATASMAATATIGLLGMAQPSDADAIPSPLQVPQA
jgi:hypothetical protein